MMMLIDDDDDNDDDDADDADDDADADDDDDDDGDDDDDDDDDDVYDAGLRPILKSHLLFYLKIWRCLTCRLKDGGMEVAPEAATTKCWILCGQVW